MRIFQIGVLAVALSVGAASLVSSARAETALPGPLVTGFASDGTWSVSPGYNVVTAETSGSFGALAPMVRTGFAMAQVSYSLEVLGQAGVSIPVLANMPGVVSVSTTGLAAVATAGLSFQLSGPAGLVSSGTLGFQSVAEQGGLSAFQTGFQTTFTLLANTVYSLLLNASVGGFAYGPGSTFHALAVLDPQFSVASAFQGEGQFSVQLSDGVVNQLGVSSAPAPVPGAGLLSFLVAGLAGLRRRLRQLRGRIAAVRQALSSPRARFDRA